MDGRNSKHSSANTTQVAGTHYKTMAVEHWDLVVLNDLDYFQGQITKYVMRWRGKNGIEDLQKCRHFLEKYIEIETLRAQGRLTVRILAHALAKLEEITVKEEAADKAAAADGIRKETHCTGCGWALPMHAGNCPSQR